MCGAESVGVASAAHPGGRSEHLAPPARTGRLAGSWSVALALSCLPLPLLDVHAAPETPWT
jgi:hypothetical protein